METTCILTLGHKWKGAKQGFKITRERVVNGKHTIEVKYGITSLTSTLADAQALLAYLRNHCRIENELHYVRDVTLGEDACRVRSGDAPQVLAAMRNALIHLHSKVKAKSRPEAIEILQIHPDRAKELIGIPLSE